MRLIFSIAFFNLKFDTFLILLFNKLYPRSTDLFTANQTSKRLHVFFIVLHYCIKESNCTKKTVMANSHI